MGTGSTDPRAIDVLAVTAEDVVSALEARRQRGRPVVLRVTPPFSGRMRARIHVPVADAPGATDGGPARETERDGDTKRDGDRDGEAAPVHVDPDAFVGDAAPAYPRPAETEDALRADPDVEYTVERHHERHRAAVASWRERVREHFVEETTVATARGPVDVEVVVLG